MWAPFINLQTSKQYSIYGHVFSSISCVTVLMTVKIRSCKSIKFGILLAWTMLHHLVWSVLCNGCCKTMVWMSRLSLHTDNIWTLRVPTTKYSPKISSSPIRVPSTKWTGFMSTFYVLETFSRWCVLLYTKNK